MRLPRLSGGPLDAGAIEWTCPFATTANDLTPAFWTALAIAVGAAVGYIARLMSERLGSRSVGIVLVCACLAVVAVRL